MTTIVITRREITQNVIKKPVTVNVQGRGLMGFKGDKGDPGNLTGPASSVDENIPIFDGVAGDKLKDSGVKLSDKADASAVTAGLLLKADITDTNALSLVVADNQLRLSDYDNLLRGYNPTGAERVDIDSTSRSVSLPLNATEGGLNVLQGGMTLTNLVTNGDFSNGTTGWEAKNYSQHSVVNGKLINRATGESATPYEAQATPIALTGNADKYYIKYDVAALSAKCINIGGLNIYGTTSGTQYGVIAHTPSPVNGTVYSKSNIVTVSTSLVGNLRIHIYHIYASLGDALNSEMSLDNVVIVNLTAHGLESLTVTQVDALVAAGYFDGTKSATATRIKVVDTDDARPTYQYVEPLPLRRLADGTRDTIENGTHIQRVSDDGTTALATPITTYGVATGVPIAYPSGTITLEPVLADVGYYADKFEISRTGYPVVSLETLSIVDLATGQLTPLDISTAVIAGDGLSFTHTDLTAGNLVDVTYVWNYDGVYGENTFGYLDSTVVKADTANGKFYKAVPSFTNGVLTWTAEEVI